MWKDIEIYDFHSLKYLTKEGVDKVLSTSHYYDFHESIDEFLKKREEASYKLLTYIKEHDIFTPDIIIASEVRLFHGMHKEEKLKHLCIEGTGKILVEMPYIKWNDWMYNEIYSLGLSGYEVIIAHVESKGAN